MEPIQVGLFCILPPVIAIGLALITKEVLSSLMLGILSGTLIYALNTGAGPVSAVSSAFTIMAEEFSASMIIFLCLLGGLVAVISMAGGSRAYGEWAAKGVRSRKSAQFATGILGVLIFIDDYFNCLTVGTVMKPITDKYHISRAKLAYLIDATAAPVCIIAPVSSWAASVISNLPDEGNGGMATFLSTIPFNLYAILTIIMILVLVAFQLDFGPMQKYELEAQMQKGDITDDATAQADDISGLKVSGKGTLWDLVVPILSLIVFCILAMLYTGGYFAGGIGLFDAFGNTNANLSLAMGGFGAIIVAALLFLPRRILTFRDFMDGLTAGFKSMVPACTILTLAWTLKGVCDALSVGPYVSEVVSSSSVPIAILPAIVFAVAAFLSFSTGTAWGTFGILIPIVVPICQNVDISILSIMLAATLAGSAFVWRPLFAYFRHHHFVLHRRRVRPYHACLHADTLCAAGGGVLLCGLHCGRAYAQCGYYAGVQRGAADRRTACAAQADTQKGKRRRQSRACPARRGLTGCSHACIRLCIRGCMPA